MGREELFVELKKKVKNKNLIKHMLATEEEFIDITLKAMQDVSHDLGL